MRQRIRLNESDLHRIVKESVNKVLTELDWKTYANAARKVAARGYNPKRVKRREEDFFDAAEKAFNRDFGYNSEYDYRNGYKEIPHGKAYYTNDFNSPRNMDAVENGVYRGDFGGRGNGHPDTYGIPHFSSHAHLADKNHRTTDYYDKHASYSAHEPWRANGYHETKEHDFSDDYKDLGKLGDYTRKGNQEINDYWTNKYEYQKGKGWQLKK